MNDNILTRVLALIFALGLVAVSFVFGLFFFLVILGGSLLFALGLWLRQLLLRRRGASSMRSGVIDAEFHVIEKKRKRGDDER